MASVSYDPTALTEFVLQRDLLGLQRVQNPPETIQKADQIRYEPNAGGQWLAAVFTLITASLLSSVVFGIYIAITQRVTDPAQIGSLVQKHASFSTNTPTGFILLLGTNALATTILYWIFVRLLAKRPVYELGGRGWLKEFGAGLLLGTVLICAIIGALYAMGHYKIEGIQFSPGVILGLFIGIGPGFAEEVVMRGFVLRLLDKTTGSIPAILITSVVFGLMHIGNAHVGFIQSILLGLSAGLILGAAYYLTRRLWLAIGLHLSWNFVQGGIFNSDVSGNGYNGGLIRATFEGPEWLTGGKMGIEGSVISLGVTILVAIIMLVWAHKRGNLNKRIGGNAPRINLLHQVPRVEIWAADGGWLALPTAYELNAMLAPEEDEEADTEDSYLGELDDEEHSEEGEGVALDEETQIEDEPAPSEPESDPDEVTLLDPAEIAAAGPPITPDDSLPPVGLEAEPNEQTEQFEPVAVDTEDDVDLDAVKAPTPPPGPPTKTKVSSSVTTVTGTGTQALTDEDLDSTQQMDTLAELDATDQIKPIQQTKIEDNE